MRELEQSLIFYQDAEKLFEKKKNLLTLITAKSNIASILDDLGKENEALTMFLDVAALAQIHEHWETFGRLLNNMCNIYLRRKDWANAERTTDRAAAAARKVEDWQGYSYILTRYAYLFSQKSEFEKVRKIAEEMLELGNRFNDDVIRQSAYNAFANGFLNEAKIAKNNFLKDSF